MVDRSTHRSCVASRRGFLSSAAVGVVGALAGCEENSRTTPSGDSLELPEFEGEVLRWYYRDGPAYATWFGTGVFPGPVGSFERPGPAWDMTMAPEMWGPWVNSSIRSGAARYGLYESVEITPDEITVRIRDDARWSNGDEILGRDAVPVVMAYRMTVPTTPLAELPEAGPARPVDAVTGFEWGGKTARFLSEGDWFDDVLEQDLWSLLVRDGRGWGGIWQHTRIDPYRAWFDAVTDAWERTKRGELDPWSGEFFIRTHLREILASEGSTWTRHFHDPSNCVVSGAFRPADILGGRAIILERNPEFFAADQVDVDTVVFEVRPEEKTNWAALAANRLDYYRGSVPRKTVETFPDDIEERQVPGQDGLCLALDHHATVFERPAARQAIAYAIDTSRIAQSVHETRFDPVTIPGGHAYRLRELVGDAFVETTLTSYERDTDRAARRMRAAGFSREGGGWVDGDGEPLELSISSPSGTPTVAITVAEQLTEFGIDTSWESVPDQIFRENRDQGHLDSWPTTRGVGYALPAVGRLYASTVLQQTQAKQWFNIFPAEQVREARYDGQLLSPRTSENLDVFTLQAPPVGDPDGPPRSWHPPRLSWECSHASTVDEYVEKLRQLAWLYNWHIPVLPIANGKIQHFFDADRVEWVVGESTAFEGVGVSEFQPEDVVALGSGF